MEINTCRCGCGEQVNPGRQYIHGHTRRGLPCPMKGKHHTEESKRKMSESLKGRPSPRKGVHLSEETKRKLSEINKGNKPFEGKHHTEETKAKMRKAKLGTHLTSEHKAKLSAIGKGERNHFYGKHHTEESKTKIGQFFIGKPLSEEHKKKISQANKGKVITEEQRLKLVKANTGKHVTEETKAKLREITKRQWLTTDIRERKTGANSACWFGGKSFEPYTTAFNRQIKYLIRVRDGFSCQLCGISENETLRKLSIHHIDYDKNNSMPTNLISLCTHCHSKVNKNRIYWTDYFHEHLNNQQTHPKALIHRVSKKSTKTQESVFTLPLSLGVEL